MAYSKRLPILISTLCVVLAGVWLLAVALGHAQNVPRITKEKLRSELNNPNVSVLDVRTEGDWKSSEWKIKGAIREVPRNVEDWMDKYPKDKTLVFYCA